MQTYISYRMKTNPIHILVQNLMQNLNFDFWVFDKWMNKWMIIFVRQLSSTHSDYVFFLDYNIF